jgi:hypothetical protein
MTNPVDPYRPTTWDPHRDDDAVPPVPPRAPAAPRDPADIPELPETQSDLLARATRAGTGRPEVRLQGTEVTEARVDHDEATKARLDHFMAQWKPTYRLPSGEHVEVAAPFRMNPGWGPIPKKNNDLLHELGPLVGVSRDEVTRVQQGRGTAEQVHRLTDALLRAGKLPQQPSDMPAGLRVRKMMFEYGIGIDCAGYVQQASAAARGVPLEKAGFRPIVNEDLSRLESQGYRRVRMEDAHPGDVVVLGPPKYEDVGHRVIVAEVRPPTETEQAAIDKAVKSAESRPQTGSVKVYIVDSSWGDNGDPTAGGVKRELWFCMHQEKRDIWLQESGANAVMQTPRGPYDHPLLGVYRPKERP